MVLHYSLSVLHPEPPVIDPGGFNVWQCSCANTIRVDLKGGVHLQKQMKAILKMDKNKPVKFQFSGTNKKHNLGK